MHICATGRLFEGSLRACYFVLPRSEPAIFAVQALFKATCEGDEYSFVITQSLNE